MPLANATNRIMHGVTANSPLPPSVETAYYRKCIELKRRINEIEDSNDIIRARKLRAERAILKLRLERAMLLEQIEQRMEYNPDQSDQSESPPPTPREKPLRAKRTHRKSSPPPPDALQAGDTPQAIAPYPSNENGESRNRNSSRYSRDGGDDTEHVNGGPGSSYQTLAPAPHPRGQAEYDTPYADNNGSEAVRDGDRDAEMLDRSPVQPSPASRPRASSPGAGNAFTPGELAPSFDLF